MRKRKDKFWRREGEIPEKKEQILEKERKFPKRKITNSETGRIYSGKDKIPKK